ncbi:MAG: MFS transporter [Coriobacteriia bacterium]|nr:MFS transporter [Coriobacteriia bacterium]
MISLAKVRSKLPLIIMLAIGFLSTISMTIVLPVLPFIIQNHVHDAKNVALWVGVLEAVFSACALFSGPLLGALSDRIGRKPVLVVSLLGSAAGYVLFGLAGGLGILLVSRIIDGITAGDRAVSMAYLADITPPEERAAQFGLAGAVGGIGFMFGPAVGGLLAQFGYSVPVFVAAAITVLIALISMFVLPETITAEKRAAKLEVESPHLLQTIRDAFDHPDLRPLLFALTLAAVPFGFFALNASVLAKDAIAWGPTQIGLLVSVIGILDIVIQGGLVRFLVPRIGEHRVAIGGLLGQVVGCGLLALVGSFLPLPIVFIVGVLLFGAAEGGTTAAVQGLISRSVPDDEQGALAGGLGSIQSLMGMLVPLLGGWAYSRLGESVPYALGVLFLLSAIALIWPLLGRASSMPPKPESAVA